MWVRRGVIAAGLLLGLSGAGIFAWRRNYVSADLAEARARVVPKLKSELGARNLSYGAPIFIRIFKEPRELELWVQSGERFALFKTYPICNYSGDLGPKLKEGDFQSPEGFYLVTPDRMNPNSSYHLSFDLGFPNAYDRAHNRTGSFLMVHGKCASVGCYAVTDAGIEEIYLMAEAAFAGGQPFFQVSAFPFRMTAANMTRHKSSNWRGYWENLKEGYDLFEASNVPPQISVDGGSYVFASAARATQ